MIYDRRPDTGLHRHLLPGDILMYIAISNGPNYGSNPSGGSNPWFGVDEGGTTFSGMFVRSGYHIVSEDDPATLQYMLALSSVTTAALMVAYRNSPGLKTFTYDDPEDDPDMGPQEYPLIVGAYDFNDTGPHFQVFEDVTIPPPHFCLAMLAVTGWNYPALWLNAPDGSVDVMAISPGERTPPIVHESFGTIKAAYYLNHPLGTGPFPNLVFPPTVTPPGTEWQLGFALGIIQPPILPHEVPHLRQRQRDDLVRVGGSAKNNPTSKQNSLRAGWKNTYL